MVFEEVIRITIDILGAVAGGVIAVVIYELFRKPRLGFDLVPGDPAVDVLDGCGFYHISVKNTGRSAAVDCHLSIEYRDSDDEPLVPSLILNPGKWDKNPNPLVSALMQDKDGDYFIRPLPDRSLLHFSGEVNIKASTSETFCLFVKYDGEDSIFAFNADNYILGSEANLGLRVDNRLLAQGEYVVRVVVQPDNAKPADAKFRVSNNGIYHEDVSIVRL